MHLSHNIYIYINVTLTCAKNGKRIKARTLVDSGNTVSSKSVMTKHLMFIFGTPTAIHSDQGKEFTAVTAQLSLNRICSTGNRILKKEDN